MASTKIKENHFTYGGVAYFRGHAEEIKLGSIGEKRKPINRQNYLEVKDRVSTRRLKSVKAVRVQVDFTKANKSSFNGAFKAIVEGAPVAIDGEVMLEKFKNFELDLIKLSINNNDLLRIANGSKAKLRSLIHWGKKARLVHQIFVVVEAELGSKFNSEVNINMSTKVGEWGGEANSKITAAEELSVKLAEGATFAYLMVKPTWDAKIKKNRSKIIDLDDDQWSLS